MIGDVFIAGSSIHSYIAHLRKPVESQTSKDLIKS
jgi:hypothetical protein